MRLAARSGRGPGGPTRAREKVSHGVPRTSKSNWPFRREVNTSSQRASSDRSRDARPPPWALTTSISRAAHPASRRTPERPSTRM
eukprot:9047989-Alexandrium_andersonii.AAC.1